MPAYEKELENLQRGYRLEEKVLIRIGWEQAIKLVEKKLNDNQQTKVSILDLYDEYIILKKLSPAQFDALGDFAEWVQNSNRL